ncbi:MAG: hypothetical protein M3N33_04160 [Actinomycetota bacterium]|nr:hypothetical protein [Actinomycetota bacterium]
MGERPQLIDRPSELTVGLVDHCSGARHVIPAETLSGQLQRQPRGHQALLGTVVDVALQPPTLRIGRLDNASS